VKVLFVLSEFEGEKKIAALPYMFLMNAEKEKGLGSPHYSNFIRTGVRLSTHSDKDGKMQYSDIGSNVDCALTGDDTGHYLMRFSFERAALAPPARNDGKADPALNYAGMMLPTFRSGLLPVSVQHIFERQGQLAVLKLEAQLLQPRRLHALARQ
jgi:hypothetical protein